MILCIFKNNLQCVEGLQGVKRLGVQEKPSAPPPSPMSSFALPVSACMCTVPSSHHEDPHGRESAPLDFK
jgi:hypothetical protein